LVVATHLALCPRCRKEVERLEALGGVLLEEQEAEPLAEKSLEQALARLDEAAPDEPTPSRRPGPRSAEVDPVVPRPLRDYLGDGLDQLDWTAFRGLEKVELLPEFPSFRTRLMRIKS
jgi:putative transcriptional regulator